jgi:hypothetical protein
VNSSPTTVRVPAFASCGWRCAVICSTTIRLRPEGIIKGGHLTLSSLAILFSVGTTLSATLRVRFPRSYLLAGVGPYVWTVFSRKACGSHHWCFRYKSTSFTDETCRGRVSIWLFMFVCFTTVGCCFFKVHLAILRLFAFVLVIFCTH